MCNMIDAIMPEHRIFVLCQVIALYLLLNTFVYEIAMNDFWFDCSHGFGFPPLRLLPSFCLPTHHSFRGPDGKDKTVSKDKDTRWSKAVGATTENEMCVWEKSKRILFIFGFPCTHDIFLRIHWLFRHMTSNSYYLKSFVMKRWKAKFVF